MKTSISILLSIICLALTACNDAPSTDNVGQVPATTAGSGQANNPDPAHNSANSLDWAGNYTGFLPCADCEGIHTELSLRYDLSYTIRRRYQGRDPQWFEHSGSFQWLEDGNHILLDEGEQSASYYQVGENHLRQLDMAGNRIEGDLAENYVLNKSE